MILSLVYCGLGQIYKDEVLKGVNFIIIYTLLIVSFFFPYYSSFPIRLFHIPALILMWLMGMIDAFIDDNFLMKGRRWLIWQRPLAVMPIIVISGAVFTLLILWMGILTVITGRVPASASITPTTAIHDSSDIEAVEQPDTPALFSIQVAAFKDPQKAQEIHNELLSKGYSVRIENSELSEGGWHRILIGKFQDDQDALSFARELGEKEGLSYMIVRNQKTEIE